MNKPILIALGVVAVIVIGYLAYIGLASNSTPDVAQQALPAPGQAPPKAAEEPATMPDPMRETEEEPPQAADGTPTFMLPRLSASDDLFRDGVASLTQNRGVDKWLAGSDLIRRFVGVVDNVAKGKVQRQNLAFLAPGDPLKVTRESDKVFILDDSSYRRFDVVTNIFTSLDSERAVEFYNLLRPLFQQAYEELGYGNRKFDDVVFVAIGRLLETPTLNAPVRLVRPGVLYQFEDARLEGLSDAQKQMVRMGPRNTREIQAKLSDFALHLRAVLHK